MKRNHFRHLAATAIAVVALCAASTALAQYVWVDERGVKQYSDMPPPASIPANRILKQPGGSASAPPSEVSSAAAPQTTTPEKTTAEKNVEFRKRKSEQAEKEKKAEEESKLAAEKARHCERAKEYLRALDSGVRVTRTDSSGERTFLSDEQRQQETKETRRILQDCK